MKHFQLLSRVVLIGMALSVASTAWSEKPDPRDVYDHFEAELMGQGVPGPSDRFSTQKHGSVSDKSTGDSLNTTWIGAWAHGQCFAVAVQGDFTYFGDGSYLRIADISNPGSPLELGKVLLPEEIHGVAVANNYAYVANDESGLRIIDVSNPGVPVEAGYFDTDGSARGVFVSGNYAYVADGLAGLRIIDVSNPAVPGETGYFDTGGTAFDVFVSGIYAYVADGECGLHIIRNDLDVSGIGADDVFRRGTVLFDAYPNPFNPQTTISFHILNQTGANLKVFDMSGRLVRVLLRGETTLQGRQEAVWNGRDDTGRRVASGTYFYRLEAGSYSETKKLTLVK